MESGFSLTRIYRRRRKIIWVCCALGAGYFSYRAYTSPAATRKRRQWARFFESLSSLLESAAQGSDCAGLLWKDLHSFLLSSEDEVPQTVKQFLKVGQTREFQTSVALLCRSVTQGVVSSLSGNGPALHDGSDYGSVLFEELSSRREVVGKSGKAGRDGPPSETRDGRHASKDRRWRSSGEIDASQFQETTEGGFNYRLDKLPRSESASRIVGEEMDPWSKEEDEAGRYSTWKTSKSYYREKGSWVADTGGDGGKRKSRPEWDRRGKGEAKAEGLPERLVGKLFSEAGRGFASAVVASAARSVVLSVLESMGELKKHDVNSARETMRRANSWESSSSHQNDRQKDGLSEESHTKSSPSSAFQDGLIDFLCSSKGKSVMADCIEAFVGTAVTIYLDKTRDINVYEDILSTMAKPAHREPVKELFTSVCNGAMETLVRTSHEVMSVGMSRACNGESEPTENGIIHDAERSVLLSLGESSSFMELEQSKLGDSGEDRADQEPNEAFTSASPVPRTPDKHDSKSVSISGPQSMRIAFDRTQQKVSGDDPDKVEVIELPRVTSSHQKNRKEVALSTKSTEVGLGWIDGVSRTLAVPSNRALVLDVAGTVTAEAVRSAIEVVASKVLLTLRGRLKVEEPVTEGKPSTSMVSQVFNRTGELAQATAGKAMVAMTMCVAICLHTLIGPSRIVQLS